MTFRIEHLESVVLEDIPRLSTTARSRIKKAIETKLTSHPIEFGKPLRYSPASFDLVPLVLLVFRSPFYPAYNSDVVSESIDIRIQIEVSSWPDVTVHGHRGGIVFFQVGNREIGHLHGSRFADLPFPVRIREELVAAGKADLHYLHPQSGWITYHIHSQEDFEPIVELFRLNYGRPWLSRVSP